MTMGAQNDKEERTEDGIRGVGGFRWRETKKCSARLQPRARAELHDLKRSHYDCVWDPADEILRFAQNDNGGSQ